MLHSPAMTAPIVLYSANSWLSYAIAERYYQSEHYVWCAPVFDARSRYAHDWHVPPTSSPCEIFKGLSEEVRRGDRHSAKIAQNKLGIIRGASVKRSAGKITEAQEKEISAIVDTAETADFRPSLYIIPYHLVSAEIRDVPVVDRAHPLSSEFILERVHRKHFDVIEEF